MTVGEASFQMALGVTMDQSIPQEVLPNDRLALVVNARVRRTGELSKRYGYSNHTRTRLDGGGGGNITTGKRFIRREHELAITDGHHIFSRVPTLQKWTTRDRIPEAQVLRHTGAISDPQISGMHDASIAVAGEYACVLARDTNGTSWKLYARVIHISSGAILDSTTLVTNSLAFAEVIAVGSTFIVIFKESGGNLIRARAFATLVASPAWGSVTTLRNDNEASGIFKTAVSSSAGIFILVHYATGPSLDAYTFDTTLTQVNNATNLRAGKTVDMLAVNVVASTLYIALHNSTDNAIEVMGRNDTTLASTFAVQTLAAAETGINMTVGMRTSISAWVLWGVAGSGATPFNNQGGIRYRAVGSGGAVDANTYTTYCVCLASRPWNYDGHTYVCAYTGHATSAVIDHLQRAIVVLDLGNDEVLGGDANYRMRPVARWGDGQIYEGNNNFIALGAVPASNVAGTFLVAHTWQSGQVSGPGRGGVVKFTTLNFSDTAAKRWVGQSQIGTDTFIPAGIPHVYDGQRCFEAGFTSDPVIAEVLKVAGGSLTIPETYQYCACFVYTDASGRTWRSAPSAVVGQALVGGGPQHLRIRITHYGATSMTDSTIGFAFPPGIELYRRSIAAPVFTRITDTGGPIFASDPTSATFFQFDDDGSGPTTANQPELYTEGGILENFCPPACRYSAVYDNRMFLAGVDDPETLHFGKEIVDGEGLGFHPDQSIRIDDGKDIQAIAVQDSSLLALKGDSDGVFYMQGNGPDDTGQGNAYSAPTKIMTAPGCIDPRSVLVGDPGVFFQSRRGIEVLTRGPGQVQFFGDPVETIVDAADAVATAVYEPNSGEYRFSVSQGNFGQKVVFTDLTKTWAVDLLFGNVDHADHVPIDAMVLDGTYHWLASTGFVYFETPSDYHDTKGAGAVWIGSGFTTGDIALAKGPLGQLRHFRIALLGRKVGTHGLTIATYLDQGTVTLQAKTFTAAEVNAFKWLPLELPLVQLTAQQGRSLRVSVVDTPEAGFESGTAGPIWFHLLIEHGGEPMPLTVPTTNRK